MVKKYKQFVNEAAVSYDSWDDNTVKEALFKALDIKPVNIVATKGDYFVTECQVTVNYMQPKDYPNGLEVNACRFIFRYFFNSNSVELAIAPHIYLSPYDREHDHKYMAMRGAVDLGKECGVPRFRKTKANNEEELANKIAKWLNKIMDIVNVYTGGYPYHTSELTVSIKDAYNK